MSSRSASRGPALDSRGARLTRRLSAQSAALVQVADDLLEPGLAADGVEIGIVPGIGEELLGHLDRAAEVLDRLGRIADLGSRNTRGCRAAGRTADAPRRWRGDAATTLGVLAALVDRPDRRPDLPAESPRTSCRTWRPSRRSSSLPPRRTPSASRPARTNTNVPAGASTLSPSSSNLARPCSDEIELLVPARPVVVLVVLVDDAVAGLARRPGGDAEARDPEVVADGPKRHRARRRAPRSRRAAQPHSHSSDPLTSSTLAPEARAWNTSSVAYAARDPSRAAQADGFFA